MRIDKLGVLPVQFTDVLADDNETHGDCIAGSVVRHESLSVQTFYKSCGVLRRAVDEVQ